MAEWNVVMMANRLKEKQTQMQESHTKITDALNGVRDEIILLDLAWKGKAKEEFDVSFMEEWEMAVELAGKTGSLITAYTMIEEAFEVGENEIAQML